MEPDTEGRSAEGGGGAVGRFRLGAAAVVGVDTEAEAGDCLDGGLLFTALICAFSSLSPSLCCPSAAPSSAKASRYRGGSAEGAPRSMGGSGCAADLRLSLAPPAAPSPGLRLPPALLSSALRTSWGCRPCLCW